MSVSVEQLAAQIRDALQRGDYRAFDAALDGLVGYITQLETALDDLLVHAPNGTPLDPYKRQGYRVLAAGRVGDTQE